MSVNAHSSLFLLIQNIVYCA